MRKEASRSMDSDWCSRQERPRRRRRSFDRSESAGGDQTDLLLARRHASGSPERRFPSRARELPKSSLPVRARYKRCRRQRGELAARPDPKDGGLAERLQGDSIVETRRRADEFRSGAPAHNRRGEAARRSLTVAPDKGVLSGSRGGVAGGFAQRRRICVV